MRHSSGFSLSRIARLLVIIFASVIAVHVILGIAVLGWIGYYYTLSTHVYAIDPHVDLTEEAAVVFTRRAIVDAGKATSNMTPLPEECGGDIERFIERLQAGNEQYKDRLMTLEQVQERARKSKAAT